MCLSLCIKSGDEEKRMSFNGFYQMFDCDLEDAAVGAKWNEWIKGLDNYLKWVNVVDGERKKAALLHHAGVEVMRIYEAVEKNHKDGKEDPETVDTYEDMKKKLADHFNPRKNRYYEKHIFRSTKQEEGESIASYATRLRNLSKYCGFQDVDSEIISQIVEGTCSKEIIGKY